MHTIHFVDDSELPDGHDFLFIGIPDGALIFYRAGALTPQNLEDSWAAYRARSGQNPPSQRAADWSHLAVASSS
jgi:hypothetical protein